jgi:hypothetical protein
MSYFHLAILAITVASALSQSAPPGPQNGRRGLSSNGPGGHAGSQRGLFLQTDVNDSSLFSGLSAPIACKTDFVKADGSVPADPKDAEYLSLAGWWR